jgi:hypothetical protein
MATREEWLAKFGKGNMARIAARNREYSLLRMALLTATMPDCAFDVYIGRAETPEYFDWLISKLPESPTK